MNVHFLIVKCRFNIYLYFIQAKRGPYFHIDKEIKVDDDILKEFTATIDDPNDKDLDRPSKVW